LFVAVNPVHPTRGLTPPARLDDFVGDVSNQSQHCQVLPGFVDAAAAEGTQCAVTGPDDLRYRRRQLAPSQRSIGELKMRGIVVIEYGLRSLSVKLTYVRHHHSRQQIEKSVHRHTQFRIDVSERMMQPGRGFPEDAVISTGTDYRSHSARRGNRAGTTATELE